MMTNTSANKSQKILTALGLIICLGALPFLGLTGCASNRCTQSRSERTDDHATSSRIRDVLSDDSQHRFFEEVKVQTFKDVIQLSGFVNTRDLKDRAGDIAKNVASGRDVRNDIVVK